MPNKEKYWYLPWIGVSLCALIFGAIGWHIAMKVSQDNTTAALTFIIVAAGTVFIYMLFIALWDTIHQAITKKKRPKEEGNTKEVEGKPIADKEEEPLPQVVQEPPPSDEIASAVMPAGKKPTVTDLKLESFEKYCTGAMSEYVTADDLQRLMNYVEQYARKGKLPITVKISTKDVDTYDLLHFGWNMWNHFNATKQPEVAKWLKSVFVELKDIDLSTIEHNLRHKERGGNYLIKIVESIE